MAKVHYLSGGRFKRLTRRQRLAAFLMRFISRFL